MIPLQVSLVFQSSPVTLVGQPRGHRPQMQSVSMFTINVNHMATQPLLHIVFQFRGFNSFPSTDFHHNIFSLGIICTELNFPSFLSFQLSCQCVNRHMVLTVFGNGHISPLIETSLHIKNYSETQTVIRPCFASLERGGGGGWVGRHL